MEYQPVRSPIRPEQLLSFRGSPTSNIQVNPAFDYGYEQTPFGQQTQASHSLQLDSRAICRDVSPLNDQLVMSYLPKTRESQLSSSHSPPLQEQLIMSQVQNDAANKQEILQLADFAEEYELARSSDQSEVQVSILKTSKNFLSRLSRVEPGEVVLQDS